MDAAETVRILTAGYPDPIWYVPTLVLLVLAYVSFVDARTGRVPDLPVALGLIGSLCSLAWYAGWFVAGERLLLVLAVIVALRLVNVIYFRFFNKDALGFGDAKWTGLAVAAFDVAPVAWGWGVAAWLALIWLGLGRVVHVFRSTYNGKVYVHFAPFLCLGLIVALFKTAILTFLNLG